MSVEELVEEVNELVEEIEEILHEMNVMGAQEIGDSMAIPAHLEEERDLGGRQPFRHGNYSKRMGSKNKQAIKKREEEIMGEEEVIREVLEEIEKEEKKETNGNRGGGRGNTYVHRPGGHLGCKGGK